MRMLRTVGYGLVVSVYIFALSFVIVFVLGLFEVDATTWYATVGWLLLVPLFAYLMPKVGRPWWHSFGMIVPLLNIFLGWDTLWRLAGRTEQGKAS